MLLQYITPVLIYFQANGSASMSSFDKYEKFFDAHLAFEREQKSASFHRLPIGDDVGEAPDPYARELTPSDDIAFAGITQIETRNYSES